MITEYEKAVATPPELRRGTVKLRAKNTRHYDVAGRLVRGQVVEVDPDMGRLLLEMHEDLEEVIETTSKPKKKDTENATER